MKIISIVSPCFNEEANVEKCYKVVKSIFENELPDYHLEHIFVDNASTDQTLEILRQIATKDVSVKVIANARNFGVDRSTFNGLRYATGDAIIGMLPVDLQDPPDLIPEFIKHWENGIEVVAGARSDREESLAMRSIRKLFYRIVNSLADFEGSKYGICFSHLFPSSVLSATGCIKVISRFRALNSCFSIS